VHHPRRQQIQSRTGFKELGRPLHQHHLAGEEQVGFRRVQEPFEVLNVLCHKSWIFGWHARSGGWGSGLGEHDERAEACLGGYVRAMGRQDRLEGQSAQRIVKGKLELRMQVGFGLLEENYLAG
jgi:hypothetical protein